MKDNGFVGFLSISETEIGKMKTGSTTDHRLFVRLSHAAASPMFSMRRASNAELAVRPALKVDAVVDLDLGVLTLISATCWTKRASSTRVP